jgi:hypothetical protein
MMYDMAATAKTNDYTANRSLSMRNAVVSEGAWSAVWNGRHGLDCWQGFWTVLRVQMHAWYLWEAGGNRMDAFMHGSGVVFKERLT